MSETAEALDDWQRHLCAPITGQKIICSFEVLAGMTRLVVDLRRWGAQRPLLIADGRGTGPLPDEADAEILVIESPKYDSLTEQVRARMRPLERLTPDIIAAVERYDPDATAAWWVSPVGPNTPMLGRPVFGGRPPEQAALEDKLIVDAMLDDLGAPRVVAVNAAARYEDLMRASGSVMEQADTDQVVWAGDNSQGINGGGDYVRWIRHDSHARDAAEFFRVHCQEVRVSPFLEGVPCSIHGIVLPDGIVVLRPVELATLLQPEQGRFLYAGLGTSWDPAIADTEYMQSLTRAFGSYLQETRGFRGAFGLDGVLTRDGFRVTEMNPRFSGALTRLARAAPEAQLELVHINALLGRDVGRPAQRIEADAGALLDQSRFVDVMGMSTIAASSETTQVDVSADETGLNLSTTPDDTIGTVVRGPAGVGTFVRLTLNPDLISRGDRCAPLAALLLDFADRQWGTGMGPGLVTPQVRT